MELPKFERSRLARENAVMHEWLERPNATARNSLRANLNSAVNPKLDLSISSSFTNIDTRLLTRVERNRRSGFAGVWWSGLHRVPPEPRDGGAARTAGAQHAAVRLSRVDAGLLVAGAHVAAGQSVPRVGYCELAAGELVAGSRHDWRRLRGSRRRQLSLQWRGTADHRDLSERLQDQRPHRSSKHDRGHRQHHAVQPCRLAELQDHVWHAVPELVLFAEHCGRGRVATGSPDTKRRAHSFRERGHDRAAHVRVLRRGSSLDQRPALRERGGSDRPEQRIRHELPAGLLSEGQSCLGPL